MFPAVQEMVFVLLELKQIRAQSFRSASTPSNTCIGVFPPLFASPTL